MDHNLFGDGEREVKLGSSFSHGSSFHSIRYDFKPASVDPSKMASLNIEDVKSVSVTVPHIEGSGTTHTVYKGNKRPIQKECVLIIDNQTGEITLEKLSSTLQLKKTRIEGSSKASQQATRPLTPSEQLKQMKSSPNKKSKKQQQQQQQQQQSQQSQQSSSQSSSQSSNQNTPQSSQSTPSSGNHSQAKKAVSNSPVKTQVHDTGSPVRLMSTSGSESGEASSSDSSDDEGAQQSSPAREVLSMPTGFPEAVQEAQSMPQQRAQPHGRNRFVSMLSEDLRLSESSSDSD